jgi:ABC-type glutathione transport system ATPase component
VVATERSNLQDDVSLMSRPAATIEAVPRMRVGSLDAYFGSVHAVKGVGMLIKDRQVTAIIGPSGCGKSTFLRCAQPHARDGSARARVEGDVRARRRSDIYADGVNAIAVRRTSAYGGPSRSKTDAIVERALRGRRSGTR